MSNLILGEKIVLVAGGLLIGAATSYLITNKLAEAKYAKIANEEIDGMKAFYDKKIAKVEKDLTPKPKKNYAVPHEPTIQKEYSKLVDTLGYSAEPAEWGKEIKPKVDPRPELTADDIQEPDVDTWNNKEARAQPIEIEPEDENWDDEVSHVDAEHEVINPSENDGPHVITEEEHFEEFPNYDKIDITWFEEDDVMIDDREEVMSDDDIKSALGVAWRSNWGFGSEDNDLVYVRNHHREMCYSITREDMGYAEFISGELLKARLRDQAVQEMKESNGQSG